MMTEKETGTFDEELLSGYLDGVLVQQEAQRVRIHLESSAEARALLAELEEMRDSAIRTSFRSIPDIQWSEKPRSGLSRWSRASGFMLFGVWVAAFVGYTLWQLAASEGLLFEKLLIFGLLTGVALLLLSVLLDRLRVAREDPYRRVNK